MSGSKLSADSKTPDDYMALALAQAQLAREKGEVPVGAVLVQEGKLIGAGHNQVIGLNDPSAHAEVMAIRDAGQRIANYRLSKAELYVTLEPCVMCAGAILHSRLSRVYFGCRDPRWGAAGSVANVLESPLLNHDCLAQGGIREAECAEMLSTFFKDKRR